MPSSSIQRHYYGLGVGFLCLVYFIFQCFYNQYAVWSVDDFWFAHRIYEFKSGLPYRDFSPYKTVLGYYLLLPTMLLGHDALSPLLYTKQFIALLNTCFFGITAIWLTRFFVKPAILAGLALIMFSNVVLTYSTNIRVDLLAYWFCLFSVLLLLDHKFIWAGITLGFSFLISQKVIWYIAASDIALACYWLFAARQQSVFYGAIQFNIAMLTVIGFYIAAWASIAGLSPVLHNMFYEAYIMFHLDVYDSTRLLFWQYTLKQNALLFLMWPLFLITLFVIPKNDNRLGKRIFLAVYATVIMSCLIPYKQVFPYYMLTILPAFIALYCAFFDWGIGLFKQSASPTLRIIDRVGLLGLLCIFSLALTLTIILMVMPLVNLLLLVIPILLGYRLLSTPMMTSRYITPCIISIIICLLGFIYPWILLAHSLNESPGNYQRAMVRLVDGLLKKGGDYLAGIELIYNKNQPIPGMRHLDAPAIIYLYKPTPELASAMLDSLYHTPDISITKAIEYLEQSSVKFYVNNYRINALPRPIKDYLASHYSHFWGSIYLYAPIIQPNLSYFNLKWTGYYRVQATHDIIIDSHRIKPDALIFLTAGKHRSSASFAYRLCLQENSLTPLMNPNDQSDQWIKLLG